MTFEEFKELALNPPYIEQKCVYRVDVYRIINDINATADITEQEVRLCQSFMYTDWNDVQFMLPRFIHKEYLNRNLYALYVYQLPLNKDVSDHLYQRLWVYDRQGNLNAQSLCSTLIEDLDTSFAKFRGRSAESIRFKPGDIVEVLDRESNITRLGVVIKQPPTIEQCLEMRNEVERACLAEGITAAETDSNYWLYSTDDCYCVVYAPDTAVAFPHTTDVFTPTHPISDELRNRFAANYHQAVETHQNKIETNKITQQTTGDRLREIHRLVDLL